MPANVKLTLPCNLDGSPRFYPPGEHPAGAKMRRELVRLREIETLRPAPPVFERPDDIERAIEWLETRLAVLELGEVVAKQQYIAQRRSQCQPTSSSRLRSTTE